MTLSTKSLKELLLLNPFEIDKLFLETSELVKAPKKQNGQNISDEEKLKIYGLYKQATLGDNKTDAPWTFQFKERAKWEAYASNKGKPMFHAKAEYIFHVNKLLNN